MKIKMPKLPKFPKRKKKLRAATTRRSFGASSEMDYEEMSEPNMKLSRALLIVLVLHIVAVAGIIAFNAIKTRQASVTSLPVPPSSTAEDANAGTMAKSAAAPKAAASPDETKVVHSSTKAISKEETKAVSPKSVHKPSALDSGKVYVVVKGDNPVTIARKFDVPYDDLISLNQIDDPRKLQIGQKLLIPRKTAKTKKAEK